MQRRRILAAGAGALGLVAVGGVWRVTRSPDSAFKPWNLAQIQPADVRMADVRMDAFRHAILAPNPHNRQPWMIKLVGDNEAIISCDLDKRLPITDPFDRQITIGFGTFLEVARIAAAQRSVAMDIDLFPQGETGRRLDGNPVALLKFGEAGSARPDPLFDAIVHRRSNKKVYDLTRKVAPNILEQILEAGGEGTVDQGQIASLRAEILAAIKTEFTTHNAHMESVALMRVGYKEVAASPDGIALSGALIEAGIVAGQISREQLGDPQSSAFQMGLDQMQQTYGSVPSLFWIKTDANTRADQIEAGRQYVRANLRATQLGLAMHPMSQSLQEYCEVSENYRAVHTLLGAKGEERIQMLARLGYGPKTAPSPRWPIDNFVSS